MRQLHLVICVNKETGSQSILSRFSQPLVFDSYQEASFAFVKEFGADNPHVGFEVARLGAEIVTADDDERESQG